MSFNFKKLYREYQQIQKNVSSNCSLEKQENAETNKYNKLPQKNQVNSNKSIIPFGFNDENNQSLQDEIKMIEKKMFAKMKKKKLYNPTKYFTFKEKILYNKNGRKEKFNLFIEEELGLNKYDDKVNILPIEEDYDSDDMIIMDGKKKTEQELFQAFEILKKKNLNEINNYKKYYK